MLIIHRDTRKSGTIIVGLKNYYALKKTRQDMHAKSVRLNRWECNLETDKLFNIFTRQLISKTELSELQIH